MPSLFKPSPVALRRFLAVQAPREFTYAEVGATNGQPSTLTVSPSYNLDHTRVELGKGAATFDRARTALERWQQFKLGWVEVFPEAAPLRAGEVVLVIARAGGLWWTNAARIVYAISDQVLRPLPLGEGRSEGTISRFGFAYGTLPGHAESGEERFLIEWDHTTDVVYFDIQAFSHPRHSLVRLNRRRARALQKRFATEAATAMQRAVGLEVGG